MGSDVAKPRWLYVVVPFNAIGSSVGSFVRLFILDLGGSVIDVGLAASAFNIALIPAAYIGGRLADYLGRRKLILIISAVGQLLSLVLMTFSGSIPVITLLFAVFSFFNSLSPPIFSLLLMETVPRDGWGEGSAYSFRYMIYGSIMGLAMSVTVLLFLPLRSMAFLPIAFSITMLTLCLALLKDPKKLVERRTVTLSRDVLMSRLVELPVILLRLPSALDFRMLLRNLRNSLTRDVPLIMSASALFFLAANLFFTSYTPFLRLNGLSYMEIVGLDLFVTIINGLASSRPFKELSKRGDPGIVVEFLTLRAMAFLFGALSSLYFTGRPILYSTLLIYLLIGVAYTNITIGLNAMLYRLMPDGRHGGTLGIYSSLNSVAMFAGSFLSGNISFYLGFPVTFLLSSLSLFAAASLFEWHFKPRRYEEYEEPF